MDFLRSEACRGIRLELEYWKPEVAMILQRVESTLVIFGSARTPSPEKAQAQLRKAKKALAAAPKNAEAKAALKRAEAAVRDSHYYQVAREFGALVTRESQRIDKTDKTFVVLTGGGGGIMEAGNRGAHDAGGLTASLNITLPFEQKANPYITPDLSFQLHYFSIRKMHFLKRARAVASFPGGFGTMDELFEVLTLIQTKKIPRMPILLFGKEYWEGLIHWQQFVDRGMITPDDLSLFSYCETAEEGWKKICDFYGIDKD